MRTCSKLTALGMPLCSLQSNGQNVFVCLALSSVRWPFILKIACSFSSLAPFRSLSRRRVPADLQNDARPSLPDRSLPSESQDVAIYAALLSAPRVLFLLRVARFPVLAALFLALQWLPRLALRYLITSSLTYPRPFHASINQEFYSPSCLNLIVFTRIGSPSSRGHVLEDVLPSSCRIRRYQNQRLQPILSSSHSHGG